MVTARVGECQIANIFGLHLAWLVIVRNVFF
jgi:hypothetical protein